MEITPLQFWSGVITLLVTQLVILYGRWADFKTQKAKDKIQQEKDKTQEPLTKAQSESAMGDALEKLGQAYDRALATIQSQDEELKGLRPLILDLALTKQQASQIQLDKDDWKAHAVKLTEQLEQNKLMPLVFRRQSANWDSDKIRAITRSQVEKYIGDKEQLVSTEKEKQE